MDANNDTSFLQALDEFNREVQEQFDTVQTAGDKEAVKGTIDKYVGTQLLNIFKGMVDVARFGGSDSAKIKAAQFLADFYFDSKSKDQTFETLINELMSKAE